MKTYISSWTSVLSQHSFLVCDHMFCMCVWESQRILFTLEESEMPDSPILKLTGPFGSNHQTCHGNTATSWCKGHQHSASINIFLQGWQWMSFWLGLCTCSSSSQQVYRSFFWELTKRRIIFSLSFLLHMPTWSKVYRDRQTETKERKSFGKSELKFYTSG